MRTTHEQCSHEIKVRMPQSVHDSVERAAAVEGRSLSNMTRRILERWAAQQQQQPGAAA
jgi:predicted HicB family RNase H-like nuclease